MRRTHRCQRSVIWRADGAACEIASRKGRLRSRLTISMPGRASNQETRVGASRSGSRSMGACRSRSSKSVPKVRPFRKEKSSTPKTRGVDAPGLALWRTKRRRVSGLQGIPNCFARRAPASPPRASPIWQSASWRRHVLRARGAARRGKLFGEGRPGTQAVFAEKAPHLERETHLAPTGRQIDEGSPGATMYADSRCTAGGAERRFSSQTGQEGDHFIANDHALDDHSWEGRRKGSQAHRPILW